MAEPALRNTSKAVLATVAMAGGVHVLYPIAHKERVTPHPSILFWLKTTTIVLLQRWGICNKTAIYVYVSNDIMFSMPPLC